MKKACLLVVIIFTAICSNAQLLKTTPEFVLDNASNIDIAFPDIKLGIEINGNQHYNSDGTLKDYYQERHNLIEEAGWKLLEVH